MTVVVVSVTTLGAGVPRIPARSQPGVRKPATNRLITSLRRSGRHSVTAGRGTPRNRRQRVLSALS
jgi:hypothetical protein